MPRTKQLKKITRPQYEDLCVQYLFEGSWACKDELKDILNGTWADTKDESWSGYRECAVKEVGDKTLTWLNKQSIEVVDE